MPVNVRVTKRRGESDERLIRRFNRKCKKQKIVQEYRSKTDYYIKPSVAKRIKKQKAIREQEKLRRKQEDKLFR
jgi:ribosomal protein S21